MPKKAVAVEYTLKQVQNLALKKDYAGTFLQKLAKDCKSSITQGKSKAIAKKRPYLRGFWH